MSKFKPGDIVIAIENKERMGARSLLPEGATRVHRTIVQDLVSQPEAFWVGQCYWLYGGAGQMPEAWLMTEDEFKAHAEAAGFTPEYHNDFAARLAARG